MLRMTSYNIRHGRGMDGRVDLERIAGVIAKTNADIVALQEVDINCTRSGNQDQAAELGRLLNMEHRFGKFMAFQGGDYGMAILSRLPIVETLRHHLPEGAEPRCALEVKVQVEGVSSPISFVCIHNDWITMQVRVQQVEALLKVLDKREAPTILAGDFNEERTDDSLRILEARQWRILDKNGKKTFPSDKPRVEIDFFITRNVPNHSIEHDVIDERLASDHRPIYAVASALIMI